MANVMAIGRRIPGLWLLTLALALAGPVGAGCGGDAGGGGGEVAMKLAGTWTGTGTFEQVVDGQRQQVQLPLGLEFGPDGVPRSLPALGLVSPWRLYADGPGELDPSPAQALGRGGVLWAYCPFEADGAANEIQIDGPSRTATAGALEWTYRAAYHFADLTRYELYDYSEPDAPEVKLDARDRYALAVTGAGVETLTIEARGTGKTVIGGKDVGLRLDARLTRGEPPAGLHCRLGPAAP
jgi:hypothetical protein